MARWQPDARGRLQEAAFTLYAERGFEDTTVAEIAERAGLTERTFFRHFADKREVLFAGAGELQERMVAAVAQAPSARSPLDAVAAGLKAAGEMFAPREAARQRQAILDANPDLRERELIKLATLADALAENLRRRGVDEPEASLTAELGMSVFKIAFSRWIASEETAPFPELVDQALAQLRSIAAVTATVR